MKISVITVTYNSAKTVADTLISVAAQTHVDSDETLSIIRSHHNPKIRVISEPDRGIYDAMNKGLAKAMGEVVGFLNSDDFYADTTVLARIAEAFQDPAVDACYGDLVYVTQDNSRVVRHWKSKPFTKDDFAKGWCPAHPTFYVRRSLQESVGLFDLSLRISGDYDFMIRCLSKPDIGVAYLPEVLVHMRTGGASNRSLWSLLDKSREDLYVLRKNKVGSWFALLCKNVRKLPQFFWRP